MTTPAQIGKTDYNTAIRDARDANREIRFALKKLLYTSNSPAVHSLITQMTLSLSENDEAIYRLAEIGRNSKQLEP